MAKTLDPAVCREIDRLFLPEQRRAVRSLLSCLDLPLCENTPPPRVHVALLWLSAGDMTSLNRIAREAEQDWRDTLVAAGLAEGDWKDRLETRGIECRGW